MALLKLLIALAVCLSCSFFFFGRTHFVTGALAGMFVSLCSLFFLSVSIKRLNATAGRYSWGYFARSFVVRLVVAGCLFLLFICVLKVNTIGILAGLLIGLITNTVFLTRLKVGP